MRSPKGEQRPQSLADRAFEEIEEMIVGGRLAPGALISESELCQILEMGRTPIREALLRLKFLGFVDVHPRRGTSVSGVDVIRHLDPRPGLRYSGPGARQVEPDVYISKDGEDYLIQINDEDVPQLRLNPQYRRMLERNQEPDKEVRNYVKERYASAIQLMKNIEQRKQTILKVCQSIVRRQLDFLESGIDELKPMMIKEIAEEIGVHPSTVSRAVASKYATPPRAFSSCATSSVKALTVPRAQVRRCLS